MKTTASATNLQSIATYLTRPVDASTLGAFRIFFGLTMVFSCVRYFYLGWIEISFLEPKFHFNFLFFPWLKPWPGNGMYYHFAILGVSALFLSLGLFYRFSTMVFFLSYTYVFLVNQINYNNHYYFICLLGFLFCFTNAHNWMSLDSLWKRKDRTVSEVKTIPYWNLLLVKAQVIIVYFFGGIAKFNDDWLRGEPMRHWLKEPAVRETTPAILSRFLESEFAAYFFSYGGLIFDLFIGFLLLYRKTRLLAIGLVLIFNIFNSWMFSIGIFPYLMIFAIILFLEPDTPRKFIHKYFPYFGDNNIFIESQSTNLKNKAATLFVSAYLLIQVMLPFRHWLYEGNVSWTEEGGYFSWHMKIREKNDCRLRFLATNPATDETWPISAERYIDLWQYKKMCRYPHMILQFSYFLGKELEQAGINNPIITARTLVSYNYRLPQPMIDPNVNLVKAEYSVFRHADWILPLKE